MKDTIKRIKRYKELKADIIDIDIRIQELEEEYLEVSAQPSGERAGKTYKITSSVEIQAEQHIKEKDKLLRKRASKEREIARIDNALTILKEEEKDIVLTALIEQKKYGLLEIKYNRTYSRIKQIEGEAVKKMEKYLTQEEFRESIRKL